MTILEVCRDPNIWGPWFKRGAWGAWFAFLAVLFGLPLARPSAKLSRDCTGRKAPLAGPYNEAWLVCGRRAGKSFILALVAAFLACFRDYRKHLAPGEWATIAIIASDRQQARVILGYLRALIFEVPMLKALVTRETRGGIELSTRVRVEVHTASFRATRGYSYAAVLADEIAFWRDESSANPDSEILNAVRPGLASVPGSMLLCASSPYAKKGALWTAYRRHFGEDGSPVLVWQAPTRTMNPTIPESVIDQALTEDRFAAEAEYLARFRNDIAAYIDREAIERAVEHGVKVRPPSSSVKAYRAFVDPSGGAQDSFTLAIGHDEKDGRVVLDLIAERKPPFSPEDVVAEFAAIAREYGVFVVTGDRYAGEWPREAFRRHGVSYELSAKVKSDLYRDTLPLLNSGKLALLDHERLVTQFAQLERKTHPGGRDSFEHPPRGHDDVANVVAGIAASAVRPRKTAGVW